MTDELQDLSDVSDDDLIEELCMRAAGEKVDPDTLDTELDTLIQQVGTLAAAEEQLAKRRQEAVEKTLALLAPQEQELAHTMMLHDLAMERLEGDDDQEEAS